MFESETPSYNNIQKSLERKSFLDFHLTNDSPKFNKRQKAPFKCSRRQTIAFRKWNRNKLRRKSYNAKNNSKHPTTDFFQNSSLYVLSRIGNASTPLRKLFWILILVIGIVGCISQVGQFLASYYEYPVVVNTESIHVAEQLFPAVTICNANTIRREFEKCLIQRLNYDDCFNDSREMSKPSDENIEVPGCYEDIKNSVNYENKILVPSILLELFLNQDYKSRRKYGHQLANFISYCKFDNFLCGLENFDEKISYYYGNCFTFNSSKANLSSKATGPSTGLELELDLEIDMYSIFTPSVGARVQIHDPYMESSVDKHGINISPGMETSISLAKEMRSRLPAPYKDGCKMYKMGDDKETCKEKCLENITLSNCFCSLSKKLRNGVPNCDMLNPHIRCCLFKIFKSFDQSSCLCPLPCEEVKYDLQVSSFVWPSRTFYESATNGTAKLNISRRIPSYEKFREQYLKLKIYYDSLDYTHHAQRPVYLSSEIFSQVGGQMGLWLGLSLIFVFECIEKILLFKKSTRNTSLQQF